MATRSLTSISTDSTVIQELHWDTLTKKIEVVHMMNLSAKVNARWVSMTPYPPGSLNYDTMCKKYSLDPRKGIYITEFIYQEYEDLSYRDPHAVKFPESGEYYPLSELTHMVSVQLNRTGGTGTTSATSGEALSS
jgi:hypothetical protein